MADQHPEETDTSADQDLAQEDKGLLGDLESLLEEEGMGLDSEEDELADLFADDDDLKLAGPAPTPATSPAASSRKTRDDMHSLRRNRRRDDADTFKNIDAQIKLSSSGIKVSEDKLIAVIDRITPDDSHEHILDLLADQNICVGTN